MFINPVKLLFQYFDAPPQNSLQVCKKTIFYI